MWDAATGQPLGKPMQHVSAVQGAAFDKAEARILSWTAGSGARLWDVATGQPLGGVMTHYSPDGYGPVFNKQENRLLTWNNAVQLWDATTGLPLGAPMRHGAGLPLGAQMRSDGVFGAIFDKAESRVLSWSFDGIIRLWDVSHLMHGNLIEVACGLLADKDVSTLQRDFGIKVTDPICVNGGRDAPAPAFNSLRE